MNPCAKFKAPVDIQEGLKNIQSKPAALLQNGIRKKHIPSNVASFLLQNGNPILTSVYVGLGFGPCVLLFVATFFSFQVRVVRTSL